MTQQALSQGIDAIRAGHIEEGARLLRIALKSEEVRGSMRALGWNWLAQTLTDPQDKLRCYNEALAADPQNEYARQHIEALLGQGLPPSAGASKAAPAPPSNVPEQQQTRRQPDVEVPPAQPSAPNIEQGQRAQAVDYNNYSPSQQQKPASQQSPQSFQQDPNAIYRTVGILDGPNGRGTGFFVTRNGLVATTRYVVGGARTITYELARGQRGSGQVVRSIPTLDLTLIHTGVTVRQTLPIISTPEIPDDAPLTAITHYGRVINGHKRATRSLIKQGWFPTTIDQLADSGGNPVFNKQNLLVGMLTHNANRTAPYVFGVSIHTIYEVVERYASELRAQQGMVYCAACGSLSRAAAMGGFYCETCGAVLPGAEQIERFNMPQMASLYGETMSKPCPNCGSTVGFHRGTCLRCSYELPR